jgi:hypothetical protein
MAREWEVPEVAVRDEDYPHAVDGESKLKKLEARRFRPGQLTKADMRSGSTRKWIELWPNRYMVKELRVRNSLEGQV